MPKGTVADSGRLKKQEGIRLLQMRIGVAAGLRTCFSTDRLLQQVQGCLEKTKLRHNQAEIVFFPREDGVSQKNRLTNK
jgi:hypothetical protein